MGGLYNKTAQSMASREGIVPHAWIQEVSPDRLYRLDRTEVVQYVVFCHSKANVYVIVKQTCVRSVSS